jgi:hypothetical protein
MKIRMEVSQKIKIELSYNSAISLLDIYPKNQSQLTKHFITHVYYGKSLESA